MASLLVVLSSLKTSPKFSKLSGAIRFLKTEESLSQFVILQRSGFVAIVKDREGHCASIEPGNRFHVLVHPTGEILFGKLAACLVVGASIELDAFQVTRNNMFAFS